MNRDNIFEHRRKEDLGEGLSPDEVENTTMNMLTADLREYIAAHSLKASAELDEGALTVRRLGADEWLRLEAIDDTFLIYSHPENERAQPLGPLTRSELAEKVDEWLRHVTPPLGSIDHQTEASAHQAGHAIFDGALGKAVVRCWPRLTRDVQRELFEAAVSQLNENKRDDLAIYLHDNHPRTGASQV
jgi:hypothetical protein